MYFFAQTEDKSQIKCLDIFVSKLIRKHRLESIQDEIKTFIKAYHEIRYKSDRTLYIPNFEAYSTEQKIDLICLLRNKKKEEVSSWDLETIEENFKKCTFKEISKLEQDLLEVFS